MLSKDNSNKQYYQSEMNNDILRNLHKDQRKKTITKGNNKDESSGLVGQKNQVKENNTKQ